MATCPFSYNERIQQHDEGFWNSVPSLNSQSILRYLAQHGQVFLAIQKDRTTDRWLALSNGL